MEIGSQIALAFIYQRVCFSKCHESLFHISQSYQESVTQGNILDEETQRQTPNIGRKNNN